MKKDDIIKGTVESLAFGGQGVLKEKGFVVFVPFTTPEDSIECQIVSSKKNFAEGKLLQVLHSGPGRISPRCQHYGTCGGCQLQHIDAKTQENYKVKAVVDTLKRIGNIDLTPPLFFPAKTIWGYRRHVTFMITPQDDHYSFGYTAADGRTLLPVTECPIFLENSQPLFTALQLLLKQLKRHTSESGRLTVLKTSTDKFVLLLKFSRMPAQTEQWLEQSLASSSLLKGIMIQTPRETISKGTVSDTLHIDSLAISYDVRAFVQNHAEQSLNIYRDIVALAKAVPHQRVLDLYCGIGISSLLLGKEGSQLFGVEGNPHAVTMAKQNAAINQVKNAKFLASDVKKGLKNWLKDFKPDLVLVNPPRTGLHDEVIDQLGANPPQTLLYVSCMPSTLARDIKKLCEYGYKVDSCQLYDMFPQTSHVETLIKLTR